MNRRGHKGRVDKNQPEIVKALRAVGATVTSLAPVGDGCPDLLVGYRGETYLMEVKTATGKLTPDQVKWQESWRGDPVSTVCTIEGSFGVLNVDAKVLKL